MLTFREAFDHTKSNSGEDDLGGNIRAVDHGSKEDLDAYDQLGPLTREVLRDKMPVKWSAHQTLEHIRRMGMHPVQHDAMIARQMSMAADQVHAQLRADPNMKTQNI